jgi:hypothetical protein
MKRGAGLLALFAFVITGLHFTGGPVTMKELSEVTAAGTLKPAPKPVTREDTTCEAFESPSGGIGNDAQTEQDPNKNGEIARLIDRFLYGSAQKQRLTPGELPDGIRLMIVTIPDPRHTHLSLQFDRTLEAVQQAAQDERYTYDSSWLPWKTERVEYSSMTDRNAEMKESAEREVCPGLVLFRRSLSGRNRTDCRDAAGSVPRSGDAPYQCGLFVFVVGEEPTAGLNRVQWDNALHWIDGHADKKRPDKTLRVLGPNFSGSMPSFVRALEDTGMYAGTFTSTLLYAGRIRGCASWQWLKRQLNPALDHGTPAPTTVKLPVRIADFEENDALQTDRLYRYLKDRGHRLSEIAILSEDETAYGGLPDAAVRSTESGEGASSEDLPCNPEYYQNDRPVHLYYPRDISAIRSAYQEQSIFAQGSRSEGAGSQPQTILRPESGGGVHEGETDTIAPFSGNNLALTQEAQLYGIVNTLKTHGIRFVVLRSTNSLDYLFLTRFMHRAYPTAYIITTGSDLLFAREVDSTEFRGVVALSSFPLLPRGQDWTQQVQNVAQHAHRVFGAYTMEGVYLAARFLITDPAVAPDESKLQGPFIHPAKPDIPDYALPFWDSTHGVEGVAQPATWLAVIGRDGYWPLATLRETLGNSPRFSSLAVVERSPNPQPRNPQDWIARQRFSLPSSWRFFCVLAVLLFGMHYFACRYGYDRQDLGIFVQFTRQPGRRGPGLIAAGWGVICCLLLILFLTVLRIYPYLGDPDKAWVVLMGVATAGACVLAILELRWWSMPKEGDAAGMTRREWQRYCRLLTSWMFLAIALFGAAGWLILEFRPDTAGGVTTAYRSVHFTSGVSPLLSMLVLLAGFYWWFWQALSGLALLGRGRPVLPRSQSEREAHGTNQMTESIEQAALPFPNFGKSTMLLYLLPLFLVVLLALVLQRAWMQAFDLVLHSLENTAFNRTMHILIGIELYLILLESIQLYSTWQVLKRLLVALDRLPLRRTFAALQGLSMRSLWRLSGTSSRARSRIFSRQMESLAHLGNELDACESSGCGSPALRETVQATWDEGCTFMERRYEGKDFAVVNNEDAKKIRLSFRESSEAILQDLLVPAWRRERCSLEVQDAPVEGETQERIKLSDNIPVRAGEEFVCLIYVGYLQNLLGRMRTMVLSIAGLFAAIALSVGFYPYTPRPTISLSLLVLLLLIGTVVGVVFAGLDRDSTLSHITNTIPGALGSHFWLRMVSFIGVPAMGLIVAQFPEITDFVFSWIAPTMSSMR